MDSSGPDYRFLLMLLFTIILKLAKDKENNYCIVVLKNNRIIKKAPTYQLLRVL